MIKKKTIFLAAFLGTITTLSYLSWSIISFADTDNDGIIDSLDNCPQNINLGQEDFDSDRQGDSCDPDDDNDGINDNLDVFDQNPSDWADFDFDGMGTNQDHDDDNDGLEDSLDTTPILPIEKFTEKYLNNLESCLDSVQTQQLLCMSDFFDQTIKNENDVKTALALASFLPKIGAINDCHFIVHSIGEKAYDETNDLSKTLAMGEQWCRSGFYHGVMVSYFHHLKETDQNIENFADLCNPLKGTTNYRNCIHGLGHGLIHYYDNDLLLATNACNTFSYYPQTLCLGGVMMQYTDEALSRSSDLNYVIKNSCDIPELNQLESQYCFIGLGISLAAHTNDDLQQTAEYCSILSNEKRELCKSGAKREILEAQQDDISITPESEKEILQSFQIQDGKMGTIDITSSAIISNFEYEEKSFKFQTDTVSPITIYISRTLLPDNGIFTANGTIQTDVEIQTGLTGNYVMIKLTPEEYGLISMIPK